MNCDTLEEKSYRRDVSLVLLSTIGLLIFNAVVGMDNLTLSVCLCSVMHHVEHKIYKHTQQRQKR